MRELLVNILTTLLAIHSRIKNKKNTMNSKKIFQLSFLLYFSLLKRVSSRNQGCGVLILIDDTVWELYQENENLVRKQVDGYMEKLNKIYKDTILKDPPNNNIYFFTEHLTVLKSYLPDCLNKGVLLDTLSRVGGTSRYCLVHLLLHRDIGCVEGLGNLNGLCNRNSNFAWSKVHPENEDETVNTIAHEVGHNFGSEHDGGNSSTYSGCNTNETKGIMGGVKSEKFSTCSLSAMHARLQQVLKAEEEGRGCLTKRQEVSQGPKQYELDEKDMSAVSVTCPADPDPSCPQDQPDPPEIPEPPEPVCGNKEVEEPGEECDCGEDWGECEDPCCYPANLTPEDRAFNSSALPCTRNTAPLCTASPVKTFLNYGLIIPFLVILILAILLAVVLVMDWRCGSRLLYSHITERETDRLHIENREQRERRLLRENNAGINTLS